MMPELSPHNRHYAPAGGEAAVAAALQAQPQTAVPLTPDDLAALDQFHTGGIAFTRALAQHAAITAADRVLDVGGGLGGPARLLAQEVGCQVTVVDLTAAYIRLGERLTAQAHLTNQVRFQLGDALALPSANSRWWVMSSPTRIRPTGERYP